MSTIAFGENWKSMSHRTKHIAAMYFFIKAKIDEGETELEFTSML